MNRAVFITAKAVRWSATWCSGLLRLIVCDCQGYVLKLLESRTSVSLFYPFLTFRRNFMAFVSSGSACFCVLRISWFRNTGETPVYSGHFVSAWITHYSFPRRRINMDYWPSVCSFCLNKSCTFFRAALHDPWSGDPRTITMSANHGSAPGILQGFAFAQSHRLLALCQRTWQ